MITMKCRIFLLSASILLFNIYFFTLNKEDPFPNAHIFPFKNWKTIKIFINTQINTKAIYSVLNKGICSVFLLGN